MGLLDILQQVAGSVANNADHFDQVAEQAPPDVLGSGLAAAFRSDQTPAFGDMVGKMFGQSSGTQQAGVLNQIIASLGPAVLAGAAGSVLGRVLKPGATQLTPEQASQLSPDEVAKIAAHAEQQQPGIIDQVSAFYAQHPTLVKTVGGAALIIAMSKMQDHLINRS